MESKQIRDIMEAYSSIYNNISESHFKVGDEVICKKSGMEGEVVKVDPEEKGKYYTVKREDGKTMKYAPDELKLEDGDGGASKESETKFHKKLDTLVHDTFGKRPEENGKNKSKKVEEQQTIGIPLKDASDRAAKEQLKKMIPSGEKVHTIKSSLQKANYEFEDGEELSENPLASLDKLGRSAAQSVGGEIGRRQGQKTGIPGGGLIGGLVVSNKGGQMYDKATAPLRKIPGFNKGGTVKSEDVENDIFNCLVEYLISEGYAETESSASIIICNMGESWRTSVLEELLTENALQNVGKNIGNAAKMFRIMTGIDKIPQKPPSGPANLSRIATQGPSKQPAAKPTFKIGTPPPKPKANPVGQSNLMRNIRSASSSGRRNQGISVSGGRLGAVAAGLQAYNTGDGTLKSALKRGDYKPQQGPKNPDQGLTKTQSFDKAFKTARTSGQKEFTWNNKKYNTKMK